MRIPGICAAIAGVVTTCVAVEAEPIKLFVLGGQSNMMGAGEEADLPTEPVDLSGVQSDVWYDYELGGTRDGTPITSEGWELLRPGVRGDQFGPEITFGRRIADHHTDHQVALVKVAYNGTDLAFDWHPDADDGLLLYEKMTGRVQAAVDRLTDDGHSVEVAGFLWMQGERDSAISQEVAEAYEANLERLIDRVRTDFEAPQLPFLIGQISPRTPPSQHQYRDIVRQGQANVADADALAKLVTTDHLSIRDDMLHFDSQGHMDLGDGFADAYLALPEPGSAAVGISLTMFVLFHRPRRGHEQVRESVAPPHQ